MPENTFIHAADLHLGAPFRGFAAGPEGGAVSASLMVEAGYTALGRLEALCVATDAAFLILAGDLYDAQDGVLRARFALVDMCARLARAGIAVFIAHGNHDPLGGANPVPLPPNVIVFGNQPEAYCVVRSGHPVAVVQGVSHASQRETRNLTRDFTRYEPGMPVTCVIADHDGGIVQMIASGPPPDIGPHIPRIGVLHCAVGGSGPGHAPYAPCTLGDLTESRFDYWALGHVHQGGILATEPPVVYAGSMQGLHINESGPRGCYAVRMEGPRLSARFTPLAPVQWEKAELDLDALTEPPQTMDELVDALLAAMASHPAMRRASIDTIGHHPDAVIFRLTLRGRTPLDRELRKPGALDTFTARLREEMLHSGDDRDSTPEVLLKDLVLNTSPPLDFTALAGRGDLVGETVRVADALMADPEALAAFAEKTLSPLYGHRRLRKVLTPPDEDEWTHLAAAARSILCSVLEDE